MTVLDKLCSQITIVCPLGLRAQLVDATHALNLSAGVSYSSVLRGRSFKVIIFDFEKITPQYVVGTASVVLALGVTYWLITRKSCSS